MPFSLAFARRKDVHLRLALLHRGGGGWGTLDDGCDGGFCPFCGSKIGDPSSGVAVMIYERPGRLPTLSDTVLTAKGSLRLAILIVHPV